MHFDILKNKIESIDLKEDIAYELLFTLFNQFENTSFFSCPLKIGAKLFRTRLNKEAMNYLTIKDLQNPPNHLITNYSRANIPFQSIFYVSDDLETTLAESMPTWIKDLEIGNVFSVTTSEWTVLGKVNVAFVPDFKNAKMTETFPIDKQAINMSDYKFFEFINSFFRLDTTENKEIYKITSAFCNAFIANFRLQNLDIDGILYTSVQTKQGWNIALSPTVLDDNKIALKNVVKHIIRKRGQKDGKPEYDNFLDPISALQIDKINKLIIWD